MQSAYHSLHITSSVDLLSGVVFSIDVYVYFLTKLEGRSISVLNTCAKTSHGITCVEQIFERNDELPASFYTEYRDRIYDGSRVDHDEIINENYCTGIYDTFFPGSTRFYYP